MRKILIVLFSLLFFSCSESTEKQTNSFPAKVLDLENSQLIKLLQEKPGVILDVRTSEEVSAGYIENASFINFYDDDFLEKASWIKRSQPIYVYCHAGGRSSKAAMKLISLGFKEVYNLMGGYSKWLSDDLPIVKGVELSSSNYKVYKLETVNEILESSENVLIVFKTPWCLPCKKLDTALDEFSLKYPSFEVVKINMDNNKNIADSFSVNSVPTILAFNNNVKYFSFTGFIDLENLIKSIQK
jgi:rhodanese-related sulfurtransferase/glutaredoxin